jgi:uncharacterized protein YkwD
MKNTGKKAFIITVCILLCAAAAVAAVYFSRGKSGLPPVTESTSTDAATESRTETTAVSITASVTESSSEGETKKLFTVTDSPEIAGAYTPTDFEKALFDGINAEREKRGLNALEYNSVLHTLAKIRAGEAVRFWSHSRPDGRAPSSVFADNKLSFSAFGECLARGTEESGEGAQLLTQGLLKSNKQAEIILGGDYKFLAVAVAKNADGTLSAAVLFCNP